MAYYDPGFYGTNEYHRHPIGGVLYTDSVEFFCEKHEAWWALDVVGSYYDRMKSFDFLVLTFDVEGNGASFNVRQDDDLPPIINQEIEYTDLTVSIKLFLENGILLFPSDH
jgi:hypothetical protein